jgi:flavin reductase (DIM6/NTAB) family NADH-FMN oxidoreductase RutF
MNTGMKTAMEIGERPLRHVVNSFTSVSLDPALVLFCAGTIDAARFVRALADLAEQDAGS